MKKSSGPARTSDLRVDRAGAVSSASSALGPETPLNAAAAGQEQETAHILADEDKLDRKLRSLIAPMTGGASPWAALQAWEDWAFHMATSPVRAASLGLKAWINGAQSASSAFDSAFSGGAPDEALAKDRRFSDPAWRRPPYNILARAQLTMESNWEMSTAPMTAVREHHMRRVRFMGDQVLQMLSPSNFACANPRVAEAFMRSGGMSAFSGLSNLADDLGRAAAGQKFFGVEDYELGRDLATTPGAVVFRNEIFELIQYAPSTPQVRCEPILVIPAWIMKYYILDLSKENSLIRYLVGQGFTVFCISWSNPTAENNARTLDDYRTKGVLAALDAVNAIVPGAQTHAVGYCLGGTMLAITAAALEREKEGRLRSITLLAAQTDFSEAGELMMFVDESQIAALEDVMNAQGYLDARQMAGAFYALRANEMLWLRLVERYLLGVRARATDLDAWFSDPTRMPACMHSQYLRWLFLENRLAEGNLYLDGKAAALKDINTPIFVVGAERDHIAPWRSVYKIALFSDAETTFVLSGGGHNSAIVSPPGKRGAYFRSQVIGSCADFVDPDEWLPNSELRHGSWWPEWSAWLKQRSSGILESPPSIGAAAKGYPALGAAPGQYVLQT